MATVRRDNAFRAGRRLVDVFADRRPRQAQLPRHGSLGASLHLHFVPNDMHLIHA
jgi:hypothetical protein